MVQNNVENHIISWAVAGFFVAVAVPLSLYDVLGHLTHYVTPDQQRYYIRILFMVPIYAIESWLALIFKVRASMRVWTVANSLL